MPTSTLTPGDEKKDEKSLNPGDRLADRLGDIERSPGKLNVDDLEKSYAGDSADVSDDYAKRKEAHAATGAPKETNDANFVNNVTPGGKSTKKGWFKKAGPALGIGGMFGIGGFALIALTSPSLLIVQMKETMAEKFNTQLASMEVRSNKLLVSKVSGATHGTCGAVITFRCKFTTMSSKQVDLMKKAGIEVVGSEKASGRIKPTKLIFNGNEIAPRDFSRMANTDPAFRSALKQAYNAKYAGFVGRAWANIAGRFKINKMPPELDANKDKAAAKEKMNKIAREGVRDTGSRARVIASPEDCKTNCISQENADDINSKANQLDADTTKSAGAEVRSQLSGIGVKAATNFFKVTGPVDYACQVYGAVTALTYAAKAIRAAQLVRYAMIFFSVADAIKAGKSPDPADVALLGDTLTSTIKDSTDNTKTLVGSATDAFGYKYASYGDTGGPEQSMLIANRFMAGGGFVGDMSSATAAIIAMIPGGRSGASNTCGFLANPLVQGGSILLGIAMLAIPGANVGKLAASAAAAAAVSIVLAVLPGLLADIVAGTVTDDLVGEEAGNAITSGSGMLMSDALAGQNGNGPMTKEDALAYNSLQTQVTNEYIAYELENTSPFDATNPHTFLGSIASTLIPLRSSSNPITLVSGLFASSLQNAIPKSNAQSEADSAQALELCKDPDAEEAGYAVDPFCNVIRGIPPKYLEKDAVAVIDSLIGYGDLTSDEQPTEQYTTFIENCITTDGPIGYSSLESGFNPDEARGCVITDSHIADRYLFYMDQRIELGMNGEDIPEVDAGSDTTATLVERPPNTTDRGGGDGWTLTRNVDYTKYPCDPRTKDAGTFKSARYGWTIRLCQVTYNTSTFNSGNGGNLINSMISTNAMNMFEDAAKAGHKLGLSDGMRKRPTAYYSMHNMGLAMDLGVPRGGQTICYGIRPWWISPQAGYGSAKNAEAACNSIRYQRPEHYKAYKWLQANSTKYGFHNFVNEPWHYSTSGNGV